MFADAYWAMYPPREGRNIELTKMIDPPPLVICGIAALTVCTRR